MATSPGMRVRPHARSWTLSLLSGLVFSMMLTVCHAQVMTDITADGTLGTAVTRNNNVFDITGGTRPGNGPNLFHSFDRFNVGTGDTARFSGPAGIDHILSRVTGGSQSRIDGQLQVDIAGANLFLLNPAGVLFGSGTRLDVPGSFHVSTADVVRLADGGRLVADGSAASVLSVAEPVAFGFLRENPAGIRIEASVLEVPTGQTLSVVVAISTLSGDEQVFCRCPVVRYTSRASRHSVMSSFVPVRLV